MATTERPYLVKLVRDDVGDVLGDSTVTFEPVGEDDRRRLLKAKLLEEAAEYIAEPSLGELADLLEVVRALAHTHGVALGEVQSIADSKLLKLGGFRLGMGMFVTTTLPVSGGEDGDDA